MNAKEYIEEMKKRYTLNEWCALQICEHFTEVEDEDDDTKYDEIYIRELEQCKSWEEALDIVIRYIIR